MSLDNLLSGGFGAFIVAIFSYCMTNVLNIKAEKRRELTEYRNILSDVITYYRLGESDYNNEINEEKAAYRRIKHLITDTDVIASITTYRRVMLRGLDKNNKDDLRLCAYLLDNQDKLIDIVQNYIEGYPCTNPLPKEPDYSYTPNTLIKIDHME